MALLVIIGIICIGLGISCVIGDKDAVLYWRTLFNKIVQFILNYHGGTPTKVVLISLGILGAISGLASIGYPIGRAIVEYNESKGFLKIFLECQWDSVNIWIQAAVIISVVIIVVVYFCANRTNMFVPKEIAKIEENTTKTLAVSESNNKLLFDLFNYVGRTGSEQLSRLLPNFKNDILSLKVKSAYTHLSDIYIELNNGLQTNTLALATTEYLLGLCAKYQKDKKCERHFSRAYELMKQSNEVSPEIIEGMIYVSCKSKNEVDAYAHADELKLIAPTNYWVSVPELVFAEELNEKYNTLSNNVDKLKALANALVIGWKAPATQFGIDVNSYQYIDQHNITIENFPLWVLNLSVAATRFMQSMRVRWQINLMYTSEASELYELIDKFINLLKSTELSNILPDTVFLHAFTGYLKNQDIHWLDIMSAEKNNIHFKEFYYLAYAIMLCDQHRELEATSLLKDYGENAPSSILNMRLQIAFRYKNTIEMVDVIKYAAENKTEIPDHILPNFMAVVKNLYDEVKSYVNSLAITTEFSRDLFRQYLHYKKKDNIDIEHLRKNEMQYTPYLYPYLAEIYRDKLGLDTAIELLIKCVDRKMLDFRSSLLITYYNSDLKYSRDLFHLLRDLRLSDNLDNNLLWMELRMAENIQDYKNAIEISSLLISRCPDDANALFYHIKILRGLNENEKIKKYKTQLMNIDLPASYVKILVSIYLSIDETNFAIDFLYRKIKVTADQSLKDLYYAMHMNSEISEIIYEQKSKVDIGDYVTLNICEQEKKVDILSGSVYADLVNHSVGDKVELVIDKPCNATIVEINNKYFGLLIEIQNNIMQHASSGIKVFSIDDLNFKENPIAAIEQMIGKYGDSKKQQDIAQQEYRQGKLPLCTFVHDYDEVASMYNMIFNERFHVYTLDNLFFDNLLKDNNILGLEIVLDLSSLLLLYVFCKKKDFKFQHRFIVPISLQSLLKDALVREEKSTPSFVSQNVMDILPIQLHNTSKSFLGNVITDLLKWIERHCKLAVVEEKLNYRNLILNHRPIMSVEMDSVLLAMQGKLLLTEDWYWTKTMLKAFPSMSVYNWLHVTNNSYENEFAEFMVDCGNYGYDISASYIKKQYELLQNQLPNRFHACKENVEVNPTNYFEIMNACKLIINDIDNTDRSQIVDLLVCALKHLPYNVACLLFYRESTVNTDEIYLSCFREAIVRISPPLMFEYME